MQNENPHEPLMVVHSNVDFFNWKSEGGVFVQTIALSKQRFRKPLCRILYVFSVHPSMDMQNYMQHGASNEPLMVETTIVGLSPPSNG